jgi:hypothetical protein
VLFRSRFGDLVRRQLDLFEEEHRTDLEELRDKLDAYNDTGREDAEEAYGDYADAVGWLHEELDALRDRYAATLDEAAAADYERAFDRAVGRRRTIPARQ